MLLCSKAHPATITHEFKDSDVYRPCPADPVYYAITLVSSLTVKMPFSCPITLQFQAKGKDGSYYGKIRLVNVYKTNNKWYLIFNDKSWESKLM